MGPHQEIKVGDYVECFYNDTGSTKFVGEQGYVVEIDHTRYPYFFEKSISKDQMFGQHEIRLAIPPKKTEEPIKIVEHPNTHINQIERDLQALDENR